MKKTITVTVPATEPQTTTKEIQVPSYWCVSSSVVEEYLMILSPTVFLKVVKFSDGSYSSRSDNRLDSFGFAFTFAYEIKKNEAESIFREMQKSQHDLVFGDTLQKEIQNISIVDPYEDKTEVLHPISKK